MAENLYISDIQQLNLTGRNSKCIADVSTV